MGCTQNLKAVRRSMCLQTDEKIYTSRNLPVKMSRCWKRPVYIHPCDSSNSRLTAHSVVKELAQVLKRRRTPSSGRKFIKSEPLKWETEWLPEFLKNEMNGVMLLLYGQRASLIWWQQTPSITNSAMQDTFLAGSPRKRLEDDQRMQKSSLQLTDFVPSFTRMINFNILLPSRKIEWVKKASLYTAGHT